MEKSITLGGKSLPCIDELPAGLLLDLAEATEIGGMRVVSEYRKFIYAAVRAEYRQQLDDILHSIEKILSLDDLNEAVGGLMVQYIGRPTSPRSPSQPGSTGIEATSRDVSSLRDTREEVTFSEPGLPVMH